MESKKKKPAKKSSPPPARKKAVKPPERIEENRHGLQPAYIGDRVWWDDDEDGFTGEYEVTHIDAQPEDQDYSTSIWLYSGDMGKEVEVGLGEIQNRIRSGDATQP